MFRYNWKARRISCKLKCNKKWQF